VSYIPSTLERNIVWGDEQLLVETGAKVCPNVKNDFLFKK